MNERIKELESQCWEPRQYGPAWFNSTKFAQSIINECIDQVAGTRIVGQLSGDEFAELSESANNKYTQWNNALVIATMNVRDHFGVEE